MSARAILLCVVFAGAALEAQAVTPIEKVVTLLNKLSAQIAAEGKEEAAEYDKYSCFCKEQADEKLYAIERSTAKISGLTAKIGELTTEIAALDSDVSDLGGKITTYETDIKTANDARTTAVADYKKQAQDLDDAVAACEGAIEAMKESKDDIADGGGKVNLVQLSASSPLLQVALLAEVANKQNPAKFAYSSNQIIGVLEGLLAKFTQSKATLDEDEMSARSAHELKVQGLGNQKTFAEKEKKEKEATSEAKGEVKADATSDKTDETKAKEADDKFMKVLTTECEDKAGKWDQRSTMRASELAAISKAVDDLTAKAMPNYKATGMTFLQTQQTSFLQLRSPTSLLSKASSSSRMAATQKVLDLLLAKSGNSPVLASVSMKVMVLQQSGIDHFVKVRQVIKDLLAKLDKDAKAEATTKAYCDKNIKTQTDARDAAKLTIEAKAAEITTSKAELAETQAAIAELQAAIAANMKELLERTELRKEEKEKNDKALKMSDEGKKSLDFAIGVLTTFYADAKTAMIQKDTYTPPNAGRDGKTVGDMAPKVFDSKYHGNQDASKGIIGILEVIQADFQRTWDQVTADDAASETDFQTAKTDTEADNVAKQDEVDKKKLKATGLKDSLVTLTDDKKGAEKNLVDAETVLEDLKKMCIDGEETYAERKAKREEEISALKDALSILENWKN